MPINEKWLWPCKHTTNLSQGYFYNSSNNKHDGLDIYKSDIEGKPVSASQSGTVAHIFTGCNNSNAARATGNSCSASTCECNNLRTIDGKSYCNYGLGNAVYIKHSDDSYSHYVHLLTLNVSLNEAVEQGDIIGTVGSTGCSTGPHLHFSLSTIDDIASGRYNNNINVINYFKLVKIKNVATGNALTVNGSVSAGTRVIQLVDSNLDSQKRLISATGTLGTIRPFDNQSYAIRFANDSRSYCKLNISEEDDSLAEISIDAVGAYYKLKIVDPNSNQNYCYLASDASGSNVYWASGDSTAYQKWSFEEV